jgi:hypothetical protein
MSRQGGLKTRPYPDPTTRYSPLATRRLFHSPFAIRRGRWAAGKMPAPQHNKGGSGTRPYLDQRHSPSFTIRHSPFFAARCSPLAILPIPRERFAKGCVLLSAAAFGIIARHGHSG